MSSYIIAGSSDKVDTSECENMANLIRQFYSDISFKIVLKDQTQWEQYVDEICRIYGFKQKSNPIVYTMDGILIGDRNAFISLAESRFGIIDPKLRQGPITPDVNKKIAKNELDAKLKLQRNKKTLIEKIEFNMLTLYIDEVVNPTEGVFKQAIRSTVSENIKTFYQNIHQIVNKSVNKNSNNESVFQSSYRNGMKFLYKFEDRLKPIRKLQETHSISEQKEIIEQECTVLVEEKNENKEKIIKSIPWFADKDKFLTIEEQQALIKHQQELALQQKEKESQASNRNSIQVDHKKDPENPMIDGNIVSPKVLTNIPQPIIENQNEEDQEQIGEQEQKLEQQQTVTLTQEQEQQQQQQQQQQEQQQQENQQVEGGQEDQQLELEQVVSVLGGDVNEKQIEEIEILEEDTSIKPNLIDISELIVHKFKNGYVLILHPFPLVDGQLLLCKPENNFLIDYSCMKRGRINSYKKSSASISPEGLYENQLDIYKCITYDDCEMIAKIVNKCDALVVLNILPQDMESFLPLSNGHFTAILREHGDLNKENKKLFKYLNSNHSSQQNSKKLMPLEQFILDQQSQCYEVSKNVKKMKQIEIMHAIVFPGNVFTPEFLHESVIQIISQCLDKGENISLKMGFHLVISRHLIFFSPSFTNYDQVNGYKLHLSAFSALGFLNLPTGSKSINYFELLQKTQIRN